MKPSTTVLLVLLCLLITYLPSSLHAQSDAVFVSGRVFDDGTNSPIDGATVELWEKVSTGRWYHYWYLQESMKTNADGQFEIHTTPETQYNLYIYFDETSSSGFDYAPVSRSWKMPEENVTFSVGLIPAASIKFEGNIKFVESSGPLTYVSYTIKDNVTDPSININYLHSYGVSSQDWIDFPSDHIVVPIDRKIVIQVTAMSRPPERGMKGTISQSFVISDVDQLNLTQGIVAGINLEKYSTWMNYDFMLSHLNTSNQLLQEAEDKGFHVVIEKQDLGKAENLVGLARSKLLNQQFRSAYINLREAYLRLFSINKSLEALHTSALTSTFLLTFFVSLTALSLSLVIFERAIPKLTLYLLLYAIFCTIFYFAYPGSSLVSMQTLISGMIISSGISLGISLILPRVMRDRFVSTLSLAKRNLKRRKTRFLLTLSTVTILVISFVSFTSFSTAYGFAMKSQVLSSNHLREGLYIGYPEPLESLTYPFIPLEDLYIDIIKSKPEVQQIAVKAENRPQLTALGYLSDTSTGQQVPFSGILGFQPSAEAAITGIDKIVVEGRFLREEEHAILISEDLARRFGVEVDNIVTLTLLSVQIEVKIVGLFDSKILQSMRDLNGKGFLPSKLVQYEAERTMLTVKTQCEPAEVIVMTLEDAMKFPFIGMSRVNALMNNPFETSSFAKELVLEQGFSVWYTQGSMIYEVFVGTFLEERGSIVFIPWLIVLLNVVITMLHSIFEYREEIVTLSAVGLNPFDIMSLFIAEAAIIGLVGGGVGYLLGIGNYKLMSGLNLVVEVRHKVTVFWSVASVLLSLSAVLVGVFIAMRSSVVITPSMRRRWKDEKETPPLGETWVFSIPFKIREDEVSSVFDFIIQSFRGHLKRKGIGEGTGKISFSEEKDLETCVKRIHFDYVLGLKSKIGSFPFDLVAKRNKDEKTYAFEVVCKGGTSEASNETVSFIRMLMIQWSANQKRT